MPETLPWGSRVRACAAWVNRNAHLADNRRQVTLERLFNKPLRDLPKRMAALDTAAFVVLQHPFKGIGPIVGLGGIAVCPL
jgi:hypothetical protein